MRKVRGLLFTAFAALALASSLTGELRVMQSGAAIVAAVGCLGFSWRTGTRVWLLVGLFFAALSVNVTAKIFAVFDTEWQLATDGSFLFAVLIGGAAIWLAALPFISSAKFRHHTRIAMTGAMLMLASAFLLDAHLASGDSATFSTIAAAIIGFLGVALMATSGARVAILARSVNRLSESILIVGVITYGAIHITAMTFASYPAIAAGLIVMSTMTLVSITTPGAHKLGSPLHPASPILTVRMWPVVLGSLAMATAHTALRLDLANGSVGGLTIAAITLGIGAMLFAAREIGGPKKPLVVPFGRRDRALQRLPSTLINGDVRLVGQPVQRTTDSKVIGIEARPEWPVLQNPNGHTIEEVAAEAGLAPLLDSITLNLAQAHLPAVLAGLEGDEPWLSVPLSVNTKAAAELPTHGKVDGLVLRIPSAEVGSAIDGLRDHGAQFQVQADVATELDPEIIAVTSAADKNDVSLKLARASEVDAGARNMWINLVVDDSKPPTNLGAILSHVELFSDESVRRIQPGRE